MGGPAAISAIHGQLRRYSTQVSFRISRSETIFATIGLCVGAFFRRWAMSSAPDERANYTGARRRQRRRSRNAVLSRSIVVVNVFGSLVPSVIVTVTSAS